MLYLLMVLLAVQLIHFIANHRVLLQLKRKDKETEMSMNNLHQWIVSNDRSVMQNLDKINELINSLYIRTRMIDLMLRNKTGGERQAGHDLQELESMLGKEQWTTSLITEATHKDAVEKIRSEDIHHYYAILIEELQNLNRQISKNGARINTHSNTHSSAGRNENPAAANGWYGRVNKAL
jgi:hypothetical protein